MRYHESVLLRESVDLLNVSPGGLYVDATFGGGGHSAEILGRLDQGKLIAFDQDPDAKRNLPDDERLRLAPHNFKFIDKTLLDWGIGQVDGILADLGISSHQIDEAERGFSFRYDAYLDMRMDKEGPLTAADFLNSAEEAELAQVLWALGEIPNAKKAARFIANSRKISPINKTSQLEQALQGCIPPQRRAKYLAQVYQALRIHVNGELEALERLLEASVSLLKTGGRLVIISYHSLEDRRVKNFFKTGNLEGKPIKDFYGNLITPWRQITRKAIQPDEDEIQRNPRSRSARLRAVEKV